MSFLWNKSFETGIDFVDQQHHGLVELINEAAPFLSAAGPIDRERTERLLDRLFAYAATHFKAEEELMHRSGVYARHAQLYGAEHA